MKDESTRKKIIDIIDHQFDLEIYLKQREVATIRQEITKAESILEDLKSAVENGKQKFFFLSCFFFLLTARVIESLAASMPEAVHYTRRSALYYHGGSQALMNPPPSPVKKKIYRLLEKNQLFGRRYDGVYVRYTQLYFLSLYNNY